MEHEVRVPLYLPRKPICHSRSSPSALASCTIPYIYANLRLSLLRFIESGIA